MSADRPSRPPTATHEGAQVITVYSPKGGVGTTTIAVNLAIHAAAAAQGRVVLIDLRLPYGHTVTHLGLRTGPSIFDAVLALRRNGPPEVLAAYTTVHESGLFVLPAPESIAAASRLTAADIELVLAAAATWFGVVVIDAGPSLDDRTTTALAAATTLVVPVVGDFGSIASLLSLTTDLERLGFARRRWELVLNHQVPSDPIRPADLEGPLGMAVRFELPYHPSLYLDAVNAGVPVSIFAPGSAPAAAFEQMALAILAPRRTAEELATAEETAEVAQEPAKLEAPAWSAPERPSNDIAYEPPREPASILAAGVPPEAFETPIEDEATWEWEPIFLAGTPPHTGTEPIDSAAIEPVEKRAWRAPAAEPSAARLAASAAVAKATARRKSALAESTDGSPAGLAVGVPLPSDRGREDRETRTRRRRRQIGVAMTSIGVSGLILATALLSMTRSGVSARPGGSPPTSPLASGKLATATPSGLPATPVPSGASGPSQSLAPTATAFGTTRPTSLIPSTGFHLPRQPQPATFVFTNGRGGCVGLATAFQDAGSFVEQGGGGLRLDIGNSTDLGSVQTNGVFDVGGAQPPNHWQGQLTTTGGTARYQVANTSGCVETYDVVISFD